jgi:hypothetical protein
MRWVEIAFGAWLGVVGLSMALFLVFGAIAFGTTWAGRRSSKVELSFADEPILASISLAVRLLIPVAMSAYGWFMFGKALRARRSGAEGSLLLASPWLLEATGRFPVLSAPVETTHWQKVASRGVAERLVVLLVYGLTAAIPLSAAAWLESALLPADPLLMTISWVVLIFSPLPLGMAVAGMIDREGSDGDRAGSRVLGFWSSLAMLVMGVLLWVAPGADKELSTGPFGEKWVGTGVATAVICLVWTWVGACPESRKSEPRKLTAGRRINLRDRRGHARRQ